MRYFTRGLVNGEFSDDEEAQAKAEAAYAQRLEAISPRLPAPVLKLAGLDLHDAEIEDVRWEPAGCGCPSTGADDCFTVGTCQAGRGRVGVCCTRVADRR